MLARRSWPEWECQASLGSWGCGGSVKMGLGDCAGPNMERWAGRMERVACLGTVRPLRVSVAGRLMRIDWEWIARRKAVVERETVTLVGFGEMWGS